MKKTAPKRKIKTFRTWGEYGPCGGQFVEIYLRAYTRENAHKRACKYFRSLYLWDKIGEHNVYVCEME